MTITEIKATYDIVDVVGRYVTLKKKGSEYVGLCPFHDDHSPSMAVVPKKQIYSCQVCDQHGDMVDFVMKFNNCTAGEAKAEISGEQGPDKKPDAPKVGKWEWVREAEDVPLPPKEHYSLKVPSMVWRYTDTFFVYRFDIDGKKDIRPLSYCQKDGQHSWRWQGVPTPRPLYNLGGLTQHPTRKVILVEGEKTADALQLLLPNTVVTTWHGGTAQVQNADLSPLDGRDVYFWPDNDAIGWAAMTVAAYIIGGGQFINSPKSAPSGWDIADVDWDSDVVKGWIKANTTQVPDLIDPPKWAEASEAAEFKMHGKTAWALLGEKCVARLAPKDDAPPAPPAPTNIGRPFLSLGYNKSSSGTTFSFYVIESKVVHTFTTAQFTTNNLLSVASLDYWEEMYPAKSKFNLDGATNNLMRDCYAAGIFRPERIRGRGAWIDDGRVVIHAGDRLIADGKQCDVTELPSKYIYEVGDSLQLSMGGGISTDQGKAFIEMLKMISWDRSVNAALLAGWCVVAPVCGALMWRPHAWITGGAGTGKTWIMREIVTRLMGQAALVLQGESTEAGIRQSLGNDARPVIFDEAEAEDKASLDRIEKILNLMRVSSAESSAKMLKGSASHTAISFNVRSCFLFASIIYQARKAADLTRVTVLSLKRGGSKEQFNKLQDEHLKVMSKSFIEGFHQRTFTMLPTLMKNIEVFEHVAAVVLKSQRLADQIAPMCAGAWMLASNEVVTEAQACKWMDAQDWSDESYLEAERDEEQCISLILESHVNVEVGEYGHKIERTVGELIDMAFGGGVTHGDVQAAKDRLARCGIKVEGAHYTISNTHKWVRGLLRGTQWEKNHGKVLSRLDDAECTPPIYYAPGHTSRGVKLHRDTLK